MLKNALRRIPAVLASCAAAAVFSAEVLAFAAPAGQVIVIR